MAKTAHTGPHNKPIRSGSLFEMFALIGESSHISSVSWTATSSAIVQLYIQKYRSIYICIYPRDLWCHGGRVNSNNTCSNGECTHMNTQRQPDTRTEWLNFTSYFMQAINMHFTLCTFLHLFLNVFLSLSLFLSFCPATTPAPHRKSLILRLSFSGRAKTNSKCLGQMLLVRPTQVLAARGARVVANGHKTDIQTHCRRHAPDTEHRTPYPLATDSGLQSRCSIWVGSMSGGP